MSPRPFASLALAFLAFLVAAATPAFAQEPPPVLKHQAQLMADATTKKDYALLVRYTYPKLVAQMGGRDKMMALMKQAMAELEGKQGFTFKSATVGTPSRIYRAGTELHALLSLDMNLESAGGTLKLYSYLLGVSGDGGKNWTFVSGSQLTPEGIRDLFPAFNKDLKVPPQPQPEFVPAPKKRQ